MIQKGIRYIKRKVRRTYNQIHAYDYKVSKKWNKFKDNPIIGDESTGTLFDPIVRFIEDKYIMCVSERKTNSLVFFYSEDGIEWDEKKTVLQGSGLEHWDAGVNRGCFLKKDNKWYLWYTGQSNGQSKIGLAMSDNGICFERISELPVLCPELKWEGVSVMNPCVMWDEETQIFKMWYAAGENYEPDVICYAESSDGIVWNKYDKAPILKSDITKPYQRAKVGGCDVMKTKDGYSIVYIAYQNVDVARICMATSVDGICNWKEVEENPIISPERKSWDAHAVYKPTICLNHKNPKELMLWYNGRKKRAEYIGLATCKMD